MASAFVGRTREITRLEELREAPLVTLWGPGGVGKTRLAREHVVREQARGRVAAWSDLAGARGRREVVTVLAAALGVVLSSGDDEVAALARAARGQGALVVADNVEQLDGDARAALAELVASGARVLVTSRERLGVAPEVAVPVAPLDEEDGLVLFTSLAGAAANANAGAAARVGARAAEGDGAAMARSIVKRLDALPLAIELAAARVPLLGAAELLARLDRKLDVLGTAKADRPARHATLRAAIAWSWDLLDDDERHALMACATFEAPFDAALAEAVMGGDEAGALDRLERLRGRALVHASAGRGGRADLRLLESVRDFAREAAEGCAAGEALAERHAAAVITRCEPLAEDATSGHAASPELERRRADLVAVTRRGGAWSARAALVLAAMYAITGPASAAVDLLEEAERALGDTHASTDQHASAGTDASTDTHASTTDATAGRPRHPAREAPAARGAIVMARLRVARGAALRAAGRLVEARASLERALAMRSALGESPEARVVVADAARVLGAVLRAAGDTTQALAREEEALVTARALGDRPREALCLGEMGAVHQSAGRLALARECHASAIAVHVATGGRRAEGVERSYLALATHRAGDPAASIPLHEQALAIHREVGHRRLEGAELLHLGFVHHELGAVAPAREAFAAARSTLAAAGARGLESLALVLAARLEADAGVPTAALLHLADAAQAAPAGWPRLTATRHLVEGHLAMNEGAPARACASYEAALATSRDHEVGFEALTPAYLALALTREAAANARTRVDALLREAHERAAALENPHLRVAATLLDAAARGAPVPDVPAAASARSSEVRRALVLCGARRPLTVEADGKRLVLPDGRVIDLSRRKNVRLVLLALARARRDTPGAAVLPDLLLDAGWPGERMRPDAATKRLHTAIWTLRTAGLEGLVLTEGEGYLLDPRVDLRLIGK